MISVYVDGVLQIPGINYTVTENSVGFSMPPGMGSHIEVMSGRHHVARILGDGSTYLFHMTVDQLKQNELLALMNDVSVYLDNPAVAEALEKLKVVIELVKQ